MGIVIFTAALIIFYNSKVNLERGTEILLEDMGREGSFIADALLSTGFPENWTEEGVMVIGISEGGRFSQEKINALAGLEYNEMRSLFRTKYDFYFFFENASSSPVPVLGGTEGIGYPGVSSSSISQVDTAALVKTVRIGIYDSQPVRMVLFLWA